ncbi:leukocyte elastase inhibitor isoform X2 [Latimeria chalumnae]|nr:PREDICTED: leukocyte elastase inhibitor-like isoform X2 [Latimeria chalumnae]XP_006011250.2 PREDICTED: leukocyte elastase inhibitor-like isoform X2 [Latimeria chalumnae]|eukprot:XP_006011249.2 PREDICTED: leukocyte elastase inhibitor-like isoform X2 [Latimeria chalumnae]
MEQQQQAQSEQDSIAELKQRLKEDKDLKFLTSANTNFALDLFKKLNETNKSGNIIFSPLSISSALAMVYLGAKGNTATQMEQALHFDKTSDVHSGFQTLTFDINQRNASYQLKLANRLYGEKTFKFVADFLRPTKEFYGAELEAVDFSNAPEMTRQQINSWVENKTEGKIQKLLAEGILNNLTRLVLVNAIYFKGNWEKKFDASHTHDRPFKLNKNESKPVQMMSQKGRFKFTFIPEYSTFVLQLPYVNKDLSMFILLPRNIDDNSTGLEKIERELTYDKLMDWINPEKMDENEVTVMLPRFKLEKNYDLNSVLISLGIQDAFSNSQADFSGMSGAKDLFLSKVVHKSFVEVNEEGTEAAAATGAVMMLRSLPLQIIADHPFLFFIWHNKTCSILFYGRFSSP